MTSLRIRPDAQIRAVAAANPAKTGYEAVRDLRHAIPPDVRLGATVWIPEATGDGDRRFIPAVVTVDAAERDLFTVAYTVDGRPDVYDLALPLLALHVRRFRP
jgi:hypothetical protein